jgi:CRISPR-associated protein Cas2
MKISHTDAKLAVIDIESTGLLTAQHEIIEIGFISYDRKNDRILEEWDQKIAPRHIETAQPEALQINGYANNPALYTGNLRNALVQLNELAKDHIVVGFNIQFDLNFLERDMKEFKMTPAWNRHRRLDMLSVAWANIQDIPLEGLGLKHICTHFNISNAGEHTALVDCRRTLCVYKALMSEYRRPK